MRRIGSLLVPLLLLPAAAAAAEDAGRAAFDAAGCATCHAVASAGITSKVSSGPDLAEAAKRDAAWLRVYLTQSESGHPVAFRGGDDELDALIAWIRALDEES